IESRHFDGNARRIGRVFDRIVHEIRHGYPQFVMVAKYKRTRAVMERFGILNRRRVEMSLERLQAFLDDCAEVNHRAVDSTAPLPGTSGLQHLLDSAQQPGGIRQDYGIELFSVGLVDFPRLQRLQVEPDRCDWSLQLMRNCVDKTVVLFISVYFPYEKNRVQHDTNDDRHEKDDAEDQLRNLAPIENNPSDVERDCECDQTCTKRNKECDRPLAASETHDSVRL